MQPSAEGTEPPGLDEHTVSGSFKLRSTGLYEVLRTRYLGKVVMTWSSRSRDWDLRIDCGDGYLAGDGKCQVDLARTGARR